MTIRARRHRTHSQRCALLIEGEHLQDCVSELGRELDFRKLLTDLPMSESVVRAVYFCSSDGSGVSFQTRLADWLSYNGYDVERSVTGRRGRHASRDRVSLAVRAIALARDFDTLVLIIGDDEYKPLVSSIQWMGSRVVVISTRRGSPPRVDDGIRRQADEFLDLSDLMPRVARDTATPSPEIVP